MEAAPHHPRHANPVFPAAMLGDGEPRQEFTLLDVSQAASRELSLGVDVPEIGTLAGRLLSHINQQPELRKSGLAGSAFRTLLLNNLTPDVARLLDPAQAAKIRAEQQKHIAADGITLRHGYHLVNGIWVRNEGPALGRGADGGGGSKDNAGGSVSPGNARLAGISESNYGGTEYGKAKLSYGNFNDMRSQGFDGKQIMAAVNTNKQLGLDVNDNPAANARLQRDTPWAIPTLHEARKELTEIHDLNKQASDAEARGDQAGAAQLRKKAEEKQKVHDEHHRGHRERMQREHPERVPDYDNRYQSIQRSVNQLSPGDENKRKANLSTVDRYRRNPNDADARRDYAALKREASANPRQRLAMAKIDKAVQQGRRAKAEKEKNNRQELAIAKREADENDRLFASLGDPAPLNSHLPVVRAENLSRGAVASGSGERPAEPKHSEAKTAANSDDAKKNSVETSTQKKTITAENKTKKIAAPTIA